MSCVQLLPCALQVYAVSGDMTKRVLLELVERVSSELLKQLQEIGNFSEEGAQHVRTEQCASGGKEGGSRELGHSLTYSLLGVCGIESPAGDTPLSYE